MTSSNSYDSIEQLIIDAELKISKVGIDKQNNLLIIFLNSGKLLFTFLDKYKRLTGASEAELKNYQLIANGKGVHWPDLDEDLSLKGFLRDELKQMVTNQSKLSA